MTNAGKAGAFVLGLFIFMIVTVALFFIAPALALGIYALALIIGVIVMLVAFFKGLLDLKDKLK